MSNQTTKETRYISPADTAKLVRQALKDAFPGITFSVTSKSYSGGASIRVAWTDGPTSGEVEDVVGRFSGSTFDGMIDLKSYHDSELNGESVHYGADSIHTNRTHSPAFFTAVAQAYCTRYHEAMPLIAVSGGDAYILKRDYSDRSDYRERIIEKVYGTNAANLDTLFAQEDRELAEYDAWVVAHKDAEIAIDEQQGHQDIIGYYNWGKVECMCAPCVQEGGIDILDQWERLTRAGAIQCAGAFTCDYCGKDFPEDVYNGSR